MLSSLLTLGIDVSKAFLDTCLLPDRKAGRYPNDAGGIGQLLADLAGLGLSHIVLEPSGGYEQPVLKALQQASQPVSLINARQIRDYARAKGVLAKTDRLDAMILADYACTIRPVPTPAACPEQARLQRVVRRRQQIIGYITQEKTALEHLEDTDLADLAHQHIQILKTQLQALERMIARIVRDNDAMARKDALLQSCNGVGGTVAATLLADFPELGTIDNRKAAALAGLAPHNRDSGNWRGQRHIGDGRASVRKVLYMAALSASRHNPDIAAFYKKKKAEGKPPKQVLIACARKLLLILNALIRDNRAWTP